MFDLPFFFPLCCVFKKPAGLDYSAFAVKSVVKLCIQNMQQVIIHMIGSEILQLLSEDHFHLILCLYRESRKFCRDREFIARITIDDRAFQCCFTFPVMVGKSGIKIGETVPDELIHHLTQLIEINVFLFTIDDRQTHKTKSKFL